METSVNNCFWCETWWKSNSFIILPESSRHHQILVRETSPSIFILLTFSEITKACQISETVSFVANSIKFQNIISCSFVCYLMDGQFPNALNKLAQIIKEFLFSYLVGWQYPNPLNKLTKDILD